MKDLHLWFEEPQKEAGCIRIAATLEYIDGGRTTMWFCFSGECADSLTDRADPFVIGLIFPVMEIARKAEVAVRLMVHGTLSPSLIRNMEEFQRAWSMWRPDLYAPCRIEAEQEVESERPMREEKAIMCFSGGVDSSFTAYRHVAPGIMRYPRPLFAGIIVQGWEYGLEEKELFLRAESRARRILSSLGIPLLRVTTNYKQIVQHWPYSHGAAVAAVLSALQRGFRSALVAQTMSYSTNHLSLEGVNPMTDWLFSSEGIQVSPDGAGHTRLQKIETLGEWQEFLENVRVCWQDEIEKSENCCRCEKCIRTILQFRVLGLGLPAAFAHDVSNKQIEALQLSPRQIAVNYGVILHEARRREIRDTWVRSLDRAIRWSKRRAIIAQRPRWQRIHYLAYRKLKRELGL